MPDKDYIAYLEHRRSELLINPGSGWRLGLSLVGSALGIIALGHLIERQPFWGLLVVVGIASGIWGWRQDFLIKQELQSIEKQLEELK